MTNPIWYQGRIREAAETPEAEAPLAGPGLITTAQVRNGACTFQPQHIERLHRDAALLGLAPVRSDEVRALMAELAQAAFPASRGVLRVLISTLSPNKTELIGSVRPWIEEPLNWTARIAPLPHTGPGPFSGAKLADVPCWRAAREWGVRVGCDECLLLNHEGDLVEGTRTNIILVDDVGILRYPDPLLGAVTGIGLSALRAAGALMQPARLRKTDLYSAQEIIAINAVRGPRPVTRLDDRPAGSGQPGPVAGQLHKMFERAIQEGFRSRK